MKILLVGHGCSPYKGSEPGNSWNWAAHMSDIHDVWLIAHPEFREEVEAELNRHPRPRLTVVWVSLPGWLDPWNPASGQKYVRLHYFLYLRFALSKARKLHQLIHFDLVHHTGWNTISVPSPFWRLAIPFIWGPIGGGQTTPKSFLCLYRQSAWRERLRTLRVRSLRYAPSLASAVKRSVLLLSTNSDTTKLLTLAGAKNVEHFLDCGAPPVDTGVSTPRKRKTEVLQLFWAGILAPRKGLELCLYALSRLPGDPPVHLRIAGDGAERLALERLCLQLNLTSKVTFLGRLSRKEMTTNFEDADAFVFSSVNDSSGSVVLEAMAHGLPVIALDHQGIGENIPSISAVKVKVLDPEGTITGLMEAVKLLLENHTLREDMGRHALEFAATQSWENRVQAMNRLYSLVLTSDD